MSRIISFSLFLLLATHVCFSQGSGQYHRIYSDTMPLSYRIDHTSLRENTFSKFPTIFPTERRKKACYEYSDELAMYVANDMESGLVYSYWMELENYLNSISKLVIPEEMLKKELIHIYIRKDGEINAASAPSGAIFFNIGLLPKLKDEASIAAVIAHEVAHFYFNHVIQRYLNEISGKFDYVLFKDTKSRNKFNVNNELQADSMGMIWMLHAGYSIEGMIEAHNMLQRHEKNILRKIENKFKIEETTHPSSERRISKINEFIAKNKLSEGHNFIVNEQLFNKLKNESKCEVLNSFIEAHDYQACIENAFGYHIFEPDNSIYIYYILEGIRRYCYFDKKRWNKNFITDNYYIKVDNDGHKKKIPMEANLFEKFDIELIPIDPNEAMMIKTKEYWREEAKFKTYNEAFSFFCKLGMDLNNPECILSNALSFGNDTIIRNKLLDSYLSFNSIKHRAYATALRNDSLYKSLPKKKLNVITEYHVDVIHGIKKTCLGRNFNDKSGVIYQTAQNSLMKNPDIETILLENLKNNSMNDFYVFTRMELLALSPHMFINRDLDLSYIDPNFWEIFYKYGVNTIEFDKVSFTPAIDEDNSFESLKKILNFDHNDMWFNSYDMAYFSVLESKFSIEKNTFKNSVSISEDYRLAHDGQTQNQLQNLLRYKKGLVFYDLRESFWGLVFAHRVKN